uniref:Gastrin/cholecystokinin type B receptor n=1 Tax=Crocodylus porosus TaxID=8502 RepID=A0A7M4FL26_CROPO
MLYVFVTIHWNACAYFALSEFLGRGSDAWVCPGAAQPGFDRLRRQYLYSFYFSTLVLTTVGDTPEPQRPVEMLFMAGGFLLGIMGFATIMGSIGSVISTMRSADTAFYPNYDLVKHYLRLHRVGRRLERRVGRWHQHLRLEKKLTHEGRILQHLPERLRAEVAVSVHLATLRKVQLFQSCERSLLEELVLKLQPQVYSPGEYVCRKGDIGREMYFIREGRLAVVADDGVTQYAVLGEGLYFGEISLINIKELEVTVRVLLYGLIFALSVLGNALVVAVLALNRRLRTVTNAFLLSLALSDLLLALCCMPFSLVPNLMGTFVFGDVVCKLMAYLMGVSVSVSTFSLVAIALERYSAICNPLQSRAWQTRSHAARVIASTWLLSALLMLPYAVYSTTVPLAQALRPPLYQCLHAWPSQPFSQAWYLMLLLILFFIPGVVMAVAYGLISRELYRGIRFEMDVKREAGGGRSSEEGDGCYVQLTGAGGALELGALSSAGPERARSSRSEAQLGAKRRVIRMLVVIVALFFLCWLPVFTANTWRAFAPGAAQRALAGAPISFIHLLSYASACANPLVYCFMNRRFRQAFLATCASTCPCACRARRPPADDDATATAPSLSKGSYTTVSSIGPL